MIEKKPEPYYIVRAHRLLMTGRLRLPKEAKLPGCPGQVPTPIGCKFLKSSAGKQLKPSNGKAALYRDQKGGQEFL